MCMGGSDTGSEARHQEVQRQGRVQQGLTQINALFGGGQYGTGAVDPSMYQKGVGQYYTASGQDLNSLDLSDPEFKAWTTKHNSFWSTPTGSPALPRYDPVASVLFGNSDGTKPNTIEQARAAYGKYLAGVGGLFSGRSSTPGFGQSFYDQRARDYRAFANPQLATQAKQQGNALSFRLANQGLLGSNAAGQLSSSFNQEIGRQRQGIADAGVSQANDLRANVENKRASLVSQLEATGDPTASTQLALSSASQFGAPSAFQPVGNLFANWSNQYMNYQNAQAYNPLAAMYQQQRYGYTGAPTGSSSSIVR